MLRVLTLSTLFPTANRPRLGCFVERQTLGLAAHPDVELRTVSPVGLPPWPLSMHSHYKSSVDLPREEAWQGVPVYRPRFLHWPGTSGRFDAGAMTRALIPLFEQVRRDFAFEVIDAEFFFPDGPAAVALGRHFGVPVSIKARGSDIHVWGRNPATAAQVTAAGQAADGLLAVSTPLKADMVTMGMPADRITVHYTGVDRDLFAAHTREEARRALGVSGAIIFCAGTLSERKGQAILIDALKDLPDVSLVLAGEGPNRDEIATRATASGVTDRVRFLGSIGHDEMARWMTSADVMALPTVSEGLANVWVEALACGTPVLTTDVGGASEVVTDAVAGTLLPRDPQAYVAAIKAILANPPSQDDVRARSLRFDWNTNRDTLYAHLSQLVANRNATS